MTYSKTLMEFKKAKKRYQREKAVVILLAIFCVAVVSWSEGWLDGIYNLFQSKEVEAVEKYDFKIDMIKVGGPAVNSESDIVGEEIVRQADEYGVDPVVAIRIAKCESSLIMRAQNQSSSAKGVFQFLDKTWKYIGAPGHQFDYKENIKQFMIWYPVHPEWWSECL